MWTFNDHRYYDPPEENDVECGNCGHLWPNNDEKRMCEECRIYGCPECVTCVEVDMDSMFVCGDCKKGLANESSI